LTPICRSEKWSHTHQHW